eukprot:TRINITY_DN76220_c0_g1_i1.p1 TRINITY_DN76220_c0_g1~~TRINITY_DN76220_c0_g1_i1.p1  ORF type:complete len:689 (-),score=122.80 TRINITY_DN76220_c0_g1_i1:34-2100(-)
MAKTAFIVAGATATGSLLAFAYLRRRLAARQPGDKMDWGLLSVLAGQCSPAHWLAHRGHARLLSLLLKVSSPNVLDADGAVTPLHCASAAGCTSAVEVLLRGGASVATTAGGYSALSMAGAQGHAPAVQLLLEARSDPSTVDVKSVSLLHLAALRGDAAISSLLLDKLAPVDTRDSGGRTPLLVACASEQRWPVALQLLKQQADASVLTFGEHLSALMLVSKWDRQAIGATEELLRCRANPSAVDAFGQTALHLACRHGSVEVVAALCASGAPPAAQDNDGQYPLQLICGRCAEFPEHRELVDVAMDAIFRADPEAPRQLDFSDATALQTLLLQASVQKAVPVVAVKALLAARGDPTGEDESGWTAAHYAASMHVGSEEMLALLQEFSSASPEFWAALDLRKKRKMSNQKYLMRRGGHHRIPVEKRQEVLGGDLTLAGVARCVAEGRYRNIVVLMGAGASTAAGIPDYRSSTGVGSCSLDEFLAQPEAFWRKKAEMFVGREPTKVHKLLARMDKNFLLRRIYTQNIDGLELAAGVSQESVVQCHGALGPCHCAAGCGQKSCKTLADIAAEIAAAPAGWRAPRCACGALLRPGVVFFGEALPGVYSSAGKDMESCDLLLVIGTSLLVYPVAGLVNRVSPLTPRLLVNREAVGPWRRSEQSEENYRDAMWKGDCDEAAAEFARLLGWHLD